MSYGVTFKARNIFIPDFPLELQEDAPVTRAHQHTVSCQWGCAQCGQRPFCTPTAAAREGAGPNRSALLTSGGDSTKLKGHPARPQT